VHHVDPCPHLLLGALVVQLQYQRPRSSRTAIGAFADAEAEGEFDFASDSSDDDYRPPVSDLPPRAHDHEAGGSSSASDPALLAILEG